MSRVKFEFIKDFKWDHGGQYITVFRKGAIIEGIMYDDGRVFANTNIWNGKAQEISHDCIKII